MTAWDLQIVEKKSNKLTCKYLLKKLTYKYISNGYLMSI